MKLEQITKKNIFYVPKGYFDDLPTRIQNRITGDGGYQKTTLSWKYAMVSIVFLMLIVTTLVLKQQSEDNFEQMLCDTDTTELLIYIESNNIESIENLDLLDDYYEEIIIESLNLEPGLLEEQLFDNDLEYFIEENLEFS